MDENEIETRLRYLLVAVNDDRLNCYSSKHEHNDRIDKLEKQNEHLLSEIARLEKRIDYTQDMIYENLTN